MLLLKFFFKIKNKNILENVIWMKEPYSIFID